MLKVLAVDDPAVAAYVDQKYKILAGYDSRVTFDVIPWSGYYAAMMDVFAGKADYDIVMVAGHLWACDLIRKGYLAELTYDFEDILPVIASEMQLDGKTYLSPSFCDGHIVTYRKSILKEIVGKTWGAVITPGEFAEAAEQIAKATGEPSVALKADQSEIFTDALPWLRMNGGDVYDNEKAVCSAPGMADGLERYCALKKIALPGTERFGNAEVATAIREKKAPLAVTWSGQMGVVYTADCMEKEDLGFAAFSTGWNVSWSFAVSDGSGNKQAAQDFLAYLRSSRVDAAVGAVSGAPIRQSSYENGLEKYPWYACQMQMFETARPLPHMEKAGEKNGILYQQIWEAFMGEKTAAEAMRDAEDQINRIG